MVSLPPRPAITSAPLVPVSTSLPAVPTMVAVRPAQETVVGGGRGALRSQTPKSRKPLLQAS